jgi:uncharacterized protein YqhQ
MMRGRRFVVCAVREPHGNIVLTSEPLAASIYSGRWSRIPFVRAITILWDTLVLGTKMLMFSANVAMAEETPGDARAATDIPVEGVARVTKVEGPSFDAVRPTPESEASARSGSVDSIPAGVAWGTLGVALAFGIGLFFVLPLFLVSLIDPWFNAVISDRAVASLLSNLLEGLIRLALLLGYIVLIGFLPDVRRVFQYHGAEHKTIAASEADAPLTAESIQRFGKEHPRCGTGFLLLVVVVSIFVFALLGQPPLVLRIASRIVLIPVVAALSYELIKFSSTRRGNPVLDWLVVRPSLALQSFTTREPDDRMVQVAVAALECLQNKERSTEST